MSKKKVLLLILASIATIAAMVLFTVQSRLQHELSQAFDKVPPGKVPLEKKDQ